LDHREGTNALDAAFLAYSGISVLRQQIKPDHRVHGVVEGKHWQPNGTHFKLGLLLPLIEFLFSDSGLCENDLAGTSTNLLRGEDTRWTCEELSPV